MGCENLTFNDDVVVNTTGKFACGTVPTKLKGAKRNLSHPLFITIV
jgi:hypothetical protein